MRYNEKISVIIPIYNSEKYLNRCIDSVINQTYNNLEIILIDDCSYDNSYKICSNYLNDKRIVLLKNKENKGVAYTRNLGIKTSTSKYITFVDSDDYMFLDCIEYLYKLQKKHNTKISVCARVNNKKKKEELLTQENALKNILSYNELELCVTSKLYLKNQFNNIEFPKKVLYEDIPVVEKIILKNKTIAYSTYQKYVYNEHKGSLTNSNYSEREKDRAILSKEIIDDICLKYPNLINYAKFFYMFSLLAVCNRIILFKIKDDKYINQSRLYIKDNIKKVLKLDVSNIKKKQLELFVFNIRMYKIIYNILKFRKK